MVMVIRDGLWERWCRIKGVVAFKKDLGGRFGGLWMSVVEVCIYESLNQLMGPRQFLKRPDAPRAYPKAEFQHLVAINPRFLHSLRSLRFPHLFQSSGPSFLTPLPSSPNIHRPQTILRSRDIHFARFFRSIYTSASIYVRRGYTVLFFRFYLLCIPN